MPFELSILFDLHLLKRKTVLKGDGFTIGSAPPKWPKYRRRFTASRKSNI